MVFAQLTARVIAPFPDDQTERYLVEQPDGQIALLETDGVSSVRTGDLIRCYANAEIGTGAETNVFTLTQHFPLADQVVALLQEQGEFESFGAVGDKLLRPGDIVGKLAGTPNHIAISRPHRVTGEHEILQHLDALAQEMKVSALNIIDPESFSFPEVAVFDEASDPMLKVVDREIAYGAYQFDAVSDNYGTEIPDHHLGSQFFIEVPSLSQNREKSKFLLPYSALDQSNLTRVETMTGLDLSQFMLKQKIAPAIWRKFVATHEFGHAVRAEQVDLQASSRFKEEVIADCFAFAVLKQQGTSDVELQKMIAWRGLGFLRSKTSLNHLTGPYLQDFAADLVENEGFSDLSLPQIMRLSVDFAEKHAPSEDMLVEKKQAYRALMADIDAPEQAGDLLGALAQKQSEGTLSPLLEKDVHALTEALERVVYTQADLSEPHILEQELKSYQQNLYQAFTDNHHKPHYLSCLFREEAKALQSCQTGEGVVSTFRQQQYDVLKKICFQLDLAETLEDVTDFAQDVPEVSVVRTENYRDASLSALCQKSVERLSANFWENLQELTKFEKQVFADFDASEDFSEMRQASVENYQTATLLFLKTPKEEREALPKAVLYGIKNPLFKHLGTDPMASRARQRYLNNIERHLSEHREKASVVSQKNRASSQFRA